MKNGTRLNAETPGSVSVQFSVTPSGRCREPATTGTQRHAPFGHRGREARQARPLGCPPGEPRGRLRIDAEPPSARRRGLRRIGRQNLEIGIGAERDERVARAAAGMLAARRGTDAKPPLEVGHAGVEIRHRVDQMIEQPQRRRRLPLTASGAAAISTPPRTTAARQPVIRIT